MSSASSTKPELWLIRHGETEWSKSGAHTSYTDLPLTEHGREQAAALAPVLAKVDFDLVLISPRQRAQETATLAGVHGSAQVEPNLQEWSYGEFEGRSTPQIREKIPDWNVWRSPITGGEIGDRVMALVHNTYAELVKITAANITHIPEGMDTVDAAAVPLVALTGDQLIREACQVQPGQTVFVSGATGSVGRCAVQSAKTLGARVFAGVREKHLDEAKTLGVEGIVALDDKDALQQLGRFDAVADTVGGETATTLLAHVRDGGVIGSLVGPVKGSELYPNVRVAMMHAHPDANRVKDFAQDLVEKKFTLPIATRFALHDAAEAQKFAQKGAEGKVLLMPL